MHFSLLPCFNAAGSLAEMKRLAFGNFKSNRVLMGGEHVHFHLG